MHACYCFDSIGPSVWWSVSTILYFLDALVNVKARNISKTVHPKLGHTSRRSPVISGMWFVLNDRSFSLHISLRLHTIGVDIDNNIHSMICIKSTVSHGEKFSVATKL